MSGHFSSDRLIELGEIKAVYGIKGWTKVFSYTRPIEQIFNYPHWLIGDDMNWQKLELEDSKQRSNRGLIAKIKNVDDRSTAQSLIGKKIAVEKTELSELETGEYYWSQLIGLEVVNLKFEKLGTVSELIETGAHDVLVVKSELSEQLIPYTESVVLKIELKANRLLVDWESDY